MKQSGKPTVPANSTEMMGPIDAEYAESAPMVQATPQGAIRTTTAYQTALSVQVPRTLKKVQAGVLEEAALMGDSWLYSWTTKNRDGSKGVVEGEGIEAAKVLARNWGNCATPPPRVVQETPTHWIFEATFIDLETGMSFGKSFRQRKPTGGAGRMSQDRAEEAAFGMGQSKAQRNAILAGMPAWLLEKAREEAKAAAEQAIKNLPDAIARACAFFDKRGVALDRLEARIGKPQARWNKRDVVTLRVIANALKENNTSVEEEFPVAPPAPAAEAPATPPAGNPAEEPPAYDPHGDPEPPAGTP